MLLLAGWAGAAPLFGLLAGVQRADLLLAVPAMVMVAALVIVGGARLGASMLALLLTTTAAALLPASTWGQLPGAVLTCTAFLVARRLTSFLRPTGRRATGPSRA